MRPFKKRSRINIVTTPKTLMIVDDSRVSRMMIKAIIVEKHPQWCLLEAGDGIEALEISADKNIDYFSLDLNMPGMDGLELLVKLKLKFIDSQFALMTANIQKTTHEKAAELGAACINKPITEDSIGRMLDFFTQNALGDEG